MKPHVLNRKFHYWLSIVVAVPAAFILCTGILLQLKKQVHWVQPPEQRGKGKEPTISMDRLLEICQGVEEAEVKTWADINRIEFRPGKGMCKVWCMNNWEVQVDTEGEGRVLQVAFRRSDIIESLHDGSFFTDWVKLGVFLPAGIILFTLLCTGMWLFWHPIYVKWRRKRIDGLHPGLVRNSQVLRVTAASTSEKN